VSLLKKFWEIFFKPVFDVGHSTVVPDQK